jgi:hypothetical protein
MAFEDLNIDDKITFLKTFYDKLFSEFVVINANVESLSDKHSSFLPLLVESVSNKSANEAMVETFDNMIASIDAKSVQRLKDFRNKAYLKRIDFNVANAQYLTPEQKHMILEILKKPKTGQN